MNQHLRGYAEQKMKHERKIDKSGRQLRGPLSIIDDTLRFKYTANTAENGPEDCSRMGVVPQQTKKPRNQKHKETQLFQGSRTKKHKKTQLFQGSRTKERRKTQLFQGSRTKKRKKTQLFQSSRTKKHKKTQLFQGSRTKKHRKTQLFQSSRTKKHKKMQLFRGSWIQKHKKTQLFQGFRGQIDQRLQNPTKTTGARSTRN